MSQKTPTLNVTYLAKDASGNFKANGGQVDGSTPKIDIVWSDPTGTAPEKIQVTLHLSYAGGSITIPLEDPAIEISGTHGVYRITGPNLDRIAQEYVDQLESLDNFTADKRLPTLQTDSIDITPVPDGNVLDTVTVQTNNQLTIAPSPRPTVSGGGGAAPAAPAPAAPVPGSGSGGWSGCSKGAVDRTSPGPCKSSAGRKSARNQPAPIAEFGPRCGPPVAGAALTGPDQCNAAYRWATDGSCACERGGSSAGRDERGGSSAGCDERGTTGDPVRSRAGAIHCRDNITPRGRTVRGPGLRPRPTKPGNRSSPGSCTARSEPRRDILDSTSSVYEPKPTANGGGLFRRKTEWISAAEGLSYSTGPALCGQTQPHVSAGRLAHCTRH